MWTKWMMSQRQFWQNRSAVELHPQLGIQWPAALDADGAVRNLAS